MKQWTYEELDFFCQITETFKKDRNYKIVYTIEEFKQILGLDTMDDKMCLKKFRTLALKFTNLSYIENDKEQIKIIPIFQQFLANNVQLEIFVSEEYSYILEKTFLQWHFTTKDLSELIQIKSYYAKKVYIHLKKIGEHGQIILKKADLLTLFFVSDSLLTQTNFNKRVIQPIRQELSLYFDSFEMNAIRGNGKGQPIKFYEFKW